jgi:hypothetical protein
MLAESFMPVPNETAAIENSPKDRCVTVTQLGDIIDKGRLTPPGSVPDSKVDYNERALAHTQCVLVRGRSSNAYGVV